MQSLKKTTILPAKFGKKEAKPEEKIKENKENLENKEIKENLIFQMVFLLWTKIKNTLEF